MSTKKPVVVESYDEIVFTEPSEAFYARVQNHRAVIVPRLPAGLNLPPPGSIVLLPCYSSIFFWIFFRTNYEVIYLFLCDSVKYH